jgi:hypothetical protein
MNTKEKFVLPTTLRGLLEETRPLTPGLLRVAERNADRLANAAGVWRQRRQMKITDADAFALMLTDVASVVEDACGGPTTASIALEAAADRVGRCAWSANDAYRALAMGAGGALKRGPSEAFRLALSVITAAGAQPEMHDPVPKESALGCFGSDLPTPAYLHRHEAFLRLKTLKGADLAALLMWGLGLRVAKGRMTTEEAKAVIKPDEWRNSLPVRAMLGGGK